MPWSARTATEWCLPTKLNYRAEFVHQVTGFIGRYTNDEIAAKWGRAERTVERKLQLIRQIWGQEMRSL